MLLHAGLPIPQNEMINSGTLFPVSFGSRLFLNQQVLSNGNTKFQTVLPELGYLSILEKAKLGTKTYQQISTTAIKRRAKSKKKAAV